MTLRRKTQGRIFLWVGVKDLSINRINCMTWDRAAYSHSIVAGGLLVTS